MRALAGTILVGGVGGGGFKSIPSLLEELDDFGATTQIPTKIETHIFVGNVGREAMLCEPAVQEIDGRRLRTKRFTIKSATEVIGNETIASLTIQTHEAMEAVAVGRALDHEAEVNRDALVADGGMT
jgi:hypothetical protein